MGAALPSPMSPPPKPPPLAPMSAPPQLLADADKKVEPVSITPPAAPPAGEARVEEEPELEELTEVELLDDPPAPAALPAFQPEVAVKEPSPAFVPPPVAIEVEDDEDEAWPVRRGGRKVRSLVAALLMLGLVIVGVAAALGYFAPALFDATAGRVIGLRLTIPAAAVVALGRAQALVGNDTVESYDRALVDLRVALALHPDYADAAGYAAVVHVLKGLSRREAAMVERARSTRAREDLATLQTADPASTAALVEPLQRVVIEGGVRADRGLEQSQKDLERAATLADEALARYPSSAMANLAAGFVKAADGEAIAEGEALLARAVELLKGKGALLDLAHPPDVLTVYLRALLWAAVPEHKPRVRDALARVLELAPNFQKARFGLALELVEASAVEEAKGLLRTVVREVPGHTNAKTMLELLEAPRIEAPPPALEPDPEPAKAKKRKTKRRR